MKKKTNEKKYKMYIGGQSKNEIVKWTTSMSEGWNERRYQWKYDNLSKDHSNMKWISAKKSNENEGDGG